MEVRAKTETSSKQDLKSLLPSTGVQVAWLVLAGFFVWFNWKSIDYLVRAWAGGDDYQHGFFVPIFALFLLWHRREMMMPLSGRGSWWGLPFFGLWAVMRWVAVYFNYGNLPEVSMLPFFLGVALFVGGWQALRWSWPAILFLIFMMPLPGNVQGMAAEKLQSMATRISVYTIQTMGIPAVAQGNVIQLTEKPIEVARACSGLRMMTLFFAICIGAALLSRKPIWERLLMIASAPPIAILSNVLRIVSTAIVYEIGSKWPSVIDVAKSGEHIHNILGLLMMPVGLLLLLGEVWLLSKLLIAPPDRPLSVGRVTAGVRTQSTAEQALRRRRN